MMKYRYDEVPLWWSTGMMKYRYDEVPVWWSTGMMKYRYDEVRLLSSFTFYYHAFLHLQFMRLDTIGNKNN